MSDPKYTAMVALHQAIHQKPVDFENTVHGLLANRIQAEVEKKREEVARNIFGSPKSEVEVDNQETPEVDTEETRSNA